MVCDDRGKSSSSHEPLIMEMLSAIAHYKYSYLLFGIIHQFIKMME